MTGAGENLREARQAYFAQQDMPPDGGYAARWVKLQAGPLPLAFPNSDARRRAVRFHDLHHLLTGYTTRWRGEAEISAWEIASSCRDHWAAWFLNLQAFALGLVIAPRASFCAFVRGRHSRNLYDSVYDDALLERSVASVRAELGLDAIPPAATRAERVSFLLWSSAALCLALAPLALLVAAILALSSA